MIRLDYATVLADAADRPQPLAAALAGPPEAQAGAFAALVLRNRTIRSLLERLATLDLLPAWYLAAGALAQTVWNTAAGNDPAYGVRDYDLVYFDDSDLSYDAEDTVIRYVAAACDDITELVETRNEARVHLWYPDRFGIAIPPYRDLNDAVDSFPATCTTIGMHLAAGVLTVYATHGFADVLSLIARPNPAGIAPPHVFDDRAARWTAKWPQLTVRRDRIEAAR